VSKADPPFLYKHHQDDMDDDHDDGHSMDDNDPEDGSETEYHDAMSAISGGKMTPRAAATTTTDNSVPVGPSSGSTGNRNPVQFGGQVDSGFELPAELAYSGTGARDQQGEGSYTFSSAFQRTIAQHPSVINHSPNVDMDSGLEGNPWSDNHLVLGKRGDRDRNFPSVPVSRDSHSGSG
jgi:hypothetical protein